MNLAIAVSWLSWMLQRLPAPLGRALDAWSYRLAARRAEERRRRNAN